jgi:hypothetical protein
LYRDDGISGLMGGGNMAEKYVEFRTTADASLRYWLAVDERDVHLASGVGGLDLEESEEHILIWWMIGNPGDSLSIVGTQGKHAVVTVKGSKIPAGSSKGAGYRKFVV